MNELRVRRGSIWGADSTRYCLDLGSLFPNRRVFLPCARFARGARDRGSGGWLRSPGWGAVLDFLEGHEGAMVGALDDIDAALEIPDNAGEVELETTLGAPTSQ